MPDCIFCKIINGSIDSAKVWEDDDFLAILDAFPNTRGMTLVMPKDHYDSYAFDMTDDFYCKFLLASKKVAKQIEKGLNVPRVCLVMEGMGVNHAHIKLYPLHGLKDKFKEVVSEERVFFNKYQGYISTCLGPAVDMAELKKIAGKIAKID